MLAATCIATDPRCGCARRMTRTGCRIQATNEDAAVGRVCRRSGWTLERQQRRADGEQHGDPDCGKQAEIERVALTLGEHGKPRWRFTVAALKKYIWNQYLRRGAA